MNEKEKASRRALRTALCLAAALALIAAGLLLGQNGDVLQKAVRVCLECIGVG